MTTQETLDVTPQQAKAAADAFLAMHGSIHSSAGIYTDDAVLDMNVPRWRFQVGGRAAITDAFDHSFPQGFTVDHKRWEPTPTGAVIEYDGHDAATGDYYRHLVLLEMRGEKIGRLTLYCTGGWEAATVEQQRREAPLVDASWDIR